MEHLVGTMELLRGGGYSESVCQAGLLHSIYGNMLAHTFSLHSIHLTREKWRQARTDSQLCHLTQMHPEHVIECERQWVSRYGSNVSGSLLTFKNVYSCVLIKLLPLLQ